MSVQLRGCEYQVEVASNVFSAHRLDLGTEMLLRAVPEVEPEAKNLLDLGCGWGPITLALADAADESAKVWAVDVNPRAVDLTQRNANAAGFSNVHACLAQDLPADVKFDVIWSNPPIRIGKKQLHELLSTWLDRLQPDGVAYLVVAKNLGADSLAKWLEENGYPTRKLASKKGYRILAVTRSDA